MKSAALAFLALLILPAACARYAPLPLPAAPSLAPNLAALDHTGIDITHPLTVEEVAALALRNAPEIAAARAQHRVAAAQRDAATILPNPQFSGALLPLLAGFGTTPAYNYVITEDIRALVTLGPRRRAARAGAAEIDAQLLWQAWQVVAAARTLAVDLIEGTRQRRLLAAEVALTARARRESESAESGYALAAAAFAPVLAAAQSQSAALADLTRLQAQRCHQLNALLGLVPDAPLPLARTVDLPPIDPVTIRSMLPTLAHRRPDLVALQLGYAVQDATLRVALLSQFPPFAFGAQGNSDNANVRNLGPQFNFDLPIFDHNQGNIAVARATRRQLHAEYRLRLNQAVGAIDAGLSELATDDANLAALAADLPAMQRDAANARAAFVRSELDLISYTDLATAALNRQTELIAAEQAERENRVALATLIGADLPQLTLDPTIARIAAGT